MGRVRINNTLVKELPIPATGQTFYRDDRLRGFAVRVTANGAKSFIVEKRIHGKNRRKTLGPYGALTADQARKLAERFIGQVASGSDPIGQARAEANAQLTLGALFARYLQVRHALKPTTVTNYKRAMHSVFIDWQDKPLIALSKDAVQQRHADYSRRSPSHANAAMRLLRALFNFAQAQYEDEHGDPLFPLNPVQRISQVKAWNRITPRTGVLKLTSMPAWFDAVARLREAGYPLSESVADLLVFLLLTGLRRGEGLGLTWTQIDFAERTIYIPDTKNHIPLLIPMSGHLHALLQQRQHLNQTIGSRFVFPGAHGGAIVDPRKQLLKVTAWSGVAFRLHDLRRTFVTVADGLELSHFAIKHLVNHKQPGDVTAGYVIMEVERLREPMERITQKILSAAGHTALTPAEHEPTA